MWNIVTSKQIKKEYRNLQTQKMCISVLEISVYITAVICE